MHPQNLNKKIVQSSLVSGNQRTERFASPGGKPPYTGEGRPSKEAVESKVPGFLGLGREKREPSISLRGADTSISLSEEAKEPTGGRI